MLISWSAPPFTLVVVHLTVLVLLGLAASLRLAPFAGADWFLGRPWTSFWRAIASGVSVVFLVTGMVGLVTLASSAALRYPPSLQFLQLLSALDIAWAGAALVVGVYRAWRLPAAVVAGSILAVVSASGRSGGIWTLSASARAGSGSSTRRVLMRRVLPFDIAAAVMAVGALLFGTRRQAMEQASPQS